MVRTIRRGYFGVFTVVAAMALLCVLAGSSVAAPGDTTRVNVASDGTQANGTSYNTPSISADGRFVGFESAASNLVAGDTNGVTDVFVHDRQTGTTERVSVDSSGNQGNGGSFKAAISADGRYVAFLSFDSNYFAGDTNGYSDVFVHDRQTGTTERVNVGSPRGLDPNGPPPSISADGRFVTFHSRASDLVADDTNGVTDVFVRDRQEGTTARVNVSSDGTQANDGTSATSFFAAEESSISADGRFVAFRSLASNLAGNDFEDTWDIFVRDRDTDVDGVFDEVGDASTEMVSVDYFGNGYGGNDYSYAPSISADGRFVTFSSNASDLVADDTNDVIDVFVRDRQTETTQRVSVNSDGTQATGGSAEPSISADGRFVTFSSASIVASDTCGHGGLFVRDRDTDADGVFDEPGDASTQLASRGGYPSISADGAYLAFLSTAIDLVPGDTNGVTDVFVHERQTETTRRSECIAPTTTASATTSSGAAYEEAAWTNKDVKVTFSAQDNQGGSGLKDIRYSASGAQTIPLTVYDPQNPPIINTEGMTTISYYATDNEGNRESSKTFSVWQDKTPPDTEIAGGPPAYANSTSASVGLSKAASEDGWIVTFQCRLDGSAFAACPQFNSYSSLSQGNHTFEGRTVDKAGNVDPSPATHSWFVDTVAPKGTVSINGGATSTGLQSVTLSLSASDRSPASGVASVRFKNEANAWSDWFDYSSKMPWTLSAGAGTKTVYAQFKDRAENLSATASDKIKYSPPR